MNEGCAVSLRGTIPDTSQSRGRRQTVVDVLKWSIHLPWCDRPGAPATRGWLEGVLQGCEDKRAKTRRPKKRAIQEGEHIIAKVRHPRKRTERSG